LSLYLPFGHWAQVVDAASEYLPLTQLTQSLSSKLAVTVLALPPTQAGQTEAPVPLEYRPVVQLVQSFPSELPIVALALPRAHSVQFGAPSAAEYLPAVQSVHSPPTSLVFPAAQLVQLSSDDVPILLDLPAEHLPVH
jgi:hypothetical protein